MFYVITVIGGGFYLSSKLEPSINIYWQISQTSPQQIKTGKWRSNVVWFCIV